MTDNIRCNVKDCEAGMRLDLFLASKEQIVSRSQAQRLLKSGNVLVNGISVSAPSRKVYSGQSIQLTIPENEHSNIESDIVSQKDKILFHQQKCPSLQIHWWHQK